MPLFWLLLACFILAPCACFLLLAVSPRLFSQGSQWFTLTYIHQALTGATAVAIVNSLWVSSAAAVLGIAIGFPIAWLTARTTLPGRRLVPGAMWLVLLLPSWLPALGWTRIVEPSGVMYKLGLDWPWVTHAIMGPFGVVLLLGLRCVPFSYLAITAALAGLGQEFEDAARVHGASRAQAMRLIIPILAPAIWSAMAIGFAESISDFGVAATLAYSSNFPLATYQLYAAIGNFPPSFPLAAGMGWLLVAAVALPLALQARALRGRSYAILSGRTRQAVRRQLSRRSALAAAVGVWLFFLVALGVPGFGAVSASLLGDLGGSFHLTLANYRALFAQPDLLSPIERSLGYGFITATITVIGGFIAARMLAQRRTKATGALDFLLLASVALPSVVFGAGYIFAYNLPIMSTARHQPVPDGDAAYHRLRRGQPAHQRPGAGRRGVAAAAVAEGRGPGARRGRANRLGPGRAARGVPAHRHGLAVHLLRRVPRAAAVPAALRAGLTARFDRHRGQPQQLSFRRRHGPGRPGRGHRAGRGRGWCSAATGCWRRQAGAG